jgi:steroid delta-isomerase-like uncharacterized protein
MSGRETIRQALEAFNRHDSQAFASRYAENAVVHDPAYPEPLRGREAIRQDTDDFLRAFPDLHGEIQTTIEDRERISYEMEMTGTHRGVLNVPAGDIPPTGKRVRLKGAGFVEIDRDGQIVEEHRYYDVAGLLGQIGLSAAGDTDQPLPRA